MSKMSDSDGTVIRNRVQPAEGTDISEPPGVATLLVADKTSNIKEHLTFENIINCVLPNWENLLYPVYPTIFNMPINKIVQLKMQ